MGQTILKSMAAQDIRQYDTVHYNCPTSIDLYIGGVKDRTIPKNGNVVKTLSTGAGYFYTDVNGGSPTAEGPICAGFFNDVSKFLINLRRTSIMWLQILNTGLEVQPKGHIAVCLPTLIHLLLLTHFLGLAPWALTCSTGVHMQTSLSISRMFPS